MAKAIVSISFALRRVIYSSPFGQSGKYLFRFSSVGGETTLQADEPTKMLLSNAVERVLVSLEKTAVVEYRAP